MKNFKELAQDIVNRMEEDAPVNSVAGGGVDLAPNAAVSQSPHMIRRKKEQEKERKAYTILHRFVFNLKRILQRVGLGSRLGSFAVALALLIKENKEYEHHKVLIERAVNSYLKETNQYDQLLNEQGEVKSNYETDPVMTCFGIDVYEKDGQLYSEDEYEKLERNSTRHS